MSAIDLSVEELLESTAREVAEKEAKSRQSIENDREDRKRSGKYDRYSDRQDGSRERSRRDRDGDGDEEMKDSDDKASANGSVRSRRRTRSPEAARRDARRERFGTSSPRRDRDRRDSYRTGGGAGAGAGGDYYRGGGRGGRGGRSRSPDDDRYYRPSGGRARRYDDDDDRSFRRRDDRDRDRNRDRDRYDDRDRDHRRGGDRDKYRRSSPPASKKTPEPSDEDRDRRTVFVQQLAARLRTKQLIEFFNERDVPVNEAQIVKDRVSQRSKG